MAARSILVFGASYGSLLAAKMALAGHSVQLVCRTRTSALINSRGLFVRMPVKGREALVEVHSHKLPGRITATTPDCARPQDHDLVVLAMQEPQYCLPGVRELLHASAQSRVPCMSIMNIPPPPYLARIPGIDPSRCEESYCDISAWKAFSPQTMTLCSPDAQAFRPPEEEGNVLQVRLPSNFKAARFEADSDTAMLRGIGESIDAARYEIDGESIDLPVKLKVHESVFVPLAKWAMLLAGNYRCLQDDGIRSIAEAVHGDIEAARAIYTWVTDLCIELGAAPEDMVPFDKYAAAARSLQSPSSAARALAAGAPNIERVDRLVQSLAAQKGRSNACLDETVARVDTWLVRNRLKG